MDEEGVRRESSSSTDFGTSEATVNGEDSSSTPSTSSPFPSPAAVNPTTQCTFHNQDEMEMMKERFAKLLLGEDMSATLFGQLWRLEPLASEKKAMWRREMEWLLCVGDHIVELIPNWQTFPDGNKLEVMTCRPRTDLYVNLPALKKLDNMLIEMLDSFSNTEFWYVDQGIITTETDGSMSFRKQLQRQAEKWWLPVPRVPPGGLREDVRKQLQHKRDSTNQILKAAMAINSVILADIKIPDSYLENLPKNGRACLGDLIYRYISSDQFSSECLLDCLDLSSEHQAIEIANRVEASMYSWRQKTTSKLNSSRRSRSKSSWEMVKDLVIDVEKRELLAERAEGLLLCLKQRFPGLPQSTLDMAKIQYNKDIGKSILESYSRVLESLAFNIVARIDDLLYVDDVAKHGELSPISKVSIIAHKTVTIPYTGLPAGTPYKTALTTPSFSPGRVEREKSPLRSPFLSSSSKIMNRGVGVKKMLTDYLNVDAKVCQVGDSIPYAIGETFAGFDDAMTHEVGKEACKSIAYAFSCEMVTSVGHNMMKDTEIVLDVWATHTFQLTSLSKLGVEDEGDLLAASVEDLIESWILDSGVSFHASPDKNSFYKLVGGRCGIAYLANGKAMPIMGKSDVEILTPTEGYKVVFEKSSWKIVKEDIMEARVTKSGALYTKAGYGDMCSVTAGGMKNEIASRDLVRDQKVIHSWPYIKHHGNKVGDLKAEGGPRTYKVKLACSNV
ncbi:hypothetical protein KSS87_004689 [Heliosperma pusillum]|nr:hypothetical protein KSS87_004689 [Heliosperma pusillum]